MCAARRARPSGHRRDPVKAQNAPRKPRERVLCCTFRLLRGRHDSLPSSLPWTRHRDALLLGRAPFLTPVLVVRRPRPMDKRGQKVYRTAGELAVQKRADGEARTRDIVLTRNGSSRQPCHLGGRSSDTSTITPLGAHLRDAAPLGARLPPAKRAGGGSRRSDLLRCTWRDKAGPLSSRSVG